MDVKYFKMTDGNDVLAEIVGESNNKIKLKNPTIIGMHEDENNPGRIQFVPFPWISPITEENTIEITQEKIMFGPLEPTNQVFQLYRSLYSKIQTATSEDMNVLNNQKNNDSSVVNLFQ